MKDRHPCLCLCAIINSNTTGHNNEVNIAARVFSLSRVALKSRDSYEAPTGVCFFFKISGKQTNMTSQTNSHITISTNALFDIVLYANILFQFILLIFSQYVTVIPHSHFQYRSNGHVS